MTNEEKHIKRRLGVENHFRVPEGYFGTLAGQIMSKIPEQEIGGFEEKSGLSAPKTQALKVNLWNRLPLRKVAAGVAVVALLGSGVVFGLRHAGGTETPGAQAEACQIAHVEKVTRHAAPATSDDAEFEQMADYAMMDNQDIYASLIAEN